MKTVRSNIERKFRRLLFWPVSTNLISVWIFHEFKFKSRKVCPPGNILVFRPCNLTPVLETSLPNNLVFHDKEIWRISVRLSDRSEVTQHKINFVKTCPQKGLNPWPPDHQSNALLTVLGRNLLKISEVSFLLFHAPLHMLELCLFLESIEQDFIKALMIHTDNQIVT